MKELQYDENLFKIIENLSIIPTDLIKIVFEYLCDKETAKKLNNSLKEISLNGTVSSRETLFLSSIFIFALEALEKGEHFDCQKWNEFSQRQGGPNTEADSNALKMLELVLVGNFAPIGSNLLLCYRPDNIPLYGNLENLSQFRQVIINSLSLIFLMTVHINPQLVKLIYAQNAKNHYMVEDKPNALTLDKALQFYLESKDVFTKTRFVELYGAKNYKLAITSQESKTLEDVCDLYCKQDEKAQSTFTQLKTKALELLNPYISTCKQQENAWLNDGIAKQKAIHARVEAQKLKSAISSSDWSQFKILIQGAVDNPSFKDSNFGPSLQKAQELITQAQDVLPSIDKINFSF